MDNDPALDVIHTTLIWQAQIKLHISKVGLIGSYKNTIYNWNHKISNIGIPNIFIYNFWGKNIFQSSSSALE